MMNLGIDISTLTKSEKKIANYIEKNIKHLFLYTEAELAQHIKVSNATLSRFWRKIGYSNFKQFKEWYKGVEPISPKLKLESILSKVKDGQFHESLFNTTKLQLMNTLEQLDDMTFQEAVVSIAKCRRLYIHAPSSSSFLAILMAHRLQRFGIEIQILPPYGEQIFEDMMHFTTEDVILLFGFVKQTTEAEILIDYATKLHYTTICITDLLISDFHKTCDYTFFVDRGEVSEFHSMLSPVFLIENLIVAIGQTRDQQSFENLERLNNLRKQYKQYIPY